MLHSCAKETSSSIEEPVSLVEEMQKLPAMSVAAKGMRNVMPSR